MAVRPDKMKAQLRLRHAIVDHDVHGGTAGNRLVPMNLDLTAGVIKFELFTLAEDFHILEIDRVKKLTLSPDRQSPSESPRIGP